MNEDIIKNVDDNCEVVVENQNNNENDVADNSTTKRGRKSKKTIKITSLIKNTFCINELGFKIDGEKSIEFDKKINENPRFKRAIELKILSIK